MNVFHDYVLPSGYMLVSGQSLFVIPSQAQTQYTVCSKLEWRNAYMNEWMDEHWYIPANPSKWWVARIESPGFHVRTLITSALEGIPMRCREPLLSLPWPQQRVQGQGQRRLCVVPDPGKWGPSSASFLWGCWSSLQWQQLRPTPTGNWPQAFVLSVPSVTLQLKFPSVTLEWSEQGQTQGRDCMQPHTHWWA